MDSALVLIADFGTLPDFAIIDENLGGYSFRPLVVALRARGGRVLVALGYGAQKLAGLGFDGPSINKPYVRRPKGNPGSNGGFNGKERATRQ